MGRNFTDTDTVHRKPYEPVKLTAVYCRIRRCTAVTAINIVPSHFDGFTEIEHANRGPFSRGNRSAVFLPSNVNGNVADDSPDAPIIPISAIKAARRVLEAATEEKGKI